MLLIPSRAEAQVTDIPVANTGLILLTCLAFGVQQVEPSWFLGFVLDGWGFGILGHMFVHGGILHLLFNMWFLWLFGDAVSTTVGNTRYVALYLGLGMLAAVVYLLLDGRPAIGASGAISAIMGIYLVFFPRSKVELLFWFLWQCRTIRVPAYLPLLLWAAFNAVASVHGTNSDIAHVDHTAGFVFGLVTAWLLLKSRFVNVYPEDPLVEAW